MSIVLFFKDLTAHSFKIIHLHHEEQIHSFTVPRRFIHCRKIYLFINPLLRHLSHIWAREYAKCPTVLHCTTAQKYGRKAEKQKGCTKPTEIVVAVVFFFFFSFFKLQVSEHTRLFSDCHKEHFNGFSTALS